jgi:four helix bundle protein
MACRLDFGALPSLLLRILRKGSRHAAKAAKLRFYNISQGSIEESRYYLILAKDLEYGDVSELSHLLEQVSKLLEAYSQVILNSDS